MQNEIIKETTLLNNDGNIAEPGWARKSFYKYDRKQIKVPAFRVKEWDYYCIMSKTRGLALTVADNGYMGLYSVTLFDFINRTEVSGSVMTPLPLGRLNMPASSASGDVTVDERTIKMSFKVDGVKRVLNLDYPDFDNGTGITAEIELSTPAEYDRMVIATPFKKRGRFYFNEKHNCLPACGKVVDKNTTYEFGSGAEENKAWGVLDWGRGVWTYKNTWYWGSASGEVNNIPFGFNIGYGFGDTSAATENILFYDNIAHKIDAVSFNIPLDSRGNEQYMEPWTFSSSDGRFEMEFVPIIDRFSDTNVLLIRSNQHQVFGHFSGKAVLDNGTVLEIKDFIGFAEKVSNRW